MQTTVRVDNQSSSTVVMTFIPQPPQGPAFLGTVEPLNGNGKSRPLSLEFIRTPGSFTKRAPDESEQATITFFPHTSRYKIQYWLGVFDDEGPTSLPRGKQTESLISGRTTLFTITPESDVFITEEI